MQPSAALKAPLVARIASRARTAVGGCLPGEAQHLFALTLLVGVVCGLLAVAFHLAIRAAERLMIERALHAPGSSWLVWTLLSPTLGGLLAGAALTWLFPGARGSGVPQVKQAFAVAGGRVRFRDALGKFWIGALQIGSGASLGREGPTVQICAGATSLLARLTALPAESARRLTPVGVAAGIAAAFNAPIAAVTFTIEEIVGKLDQTVLSGAVVAAALAAVIERGVLGAQPVIVVDQAYGLEHASSLGFYAILGVLAALASVTFTDGLLRLRLWFRGFRGLPAWTHPAIGGLVTGLLAILASYFLDVEGVTGGGYETLGRALGGQLSLRVLVALCLAKALATIFSYSSGGAGGIFAPALFIGAMLGGALGHLDVAVLQHGPRQLGEFALVGMGAVFAGVIRAPITSVLIIFEMTGGYGLVLPLMLANAISFVLARRLRPTPIYDALLAQDGIVLPRDAPSAHALERLTVADAMSERVISARPSQTAREALAAAGDAGFALLPVVGESVQLLGAARLQRLARAVSTDGADITVSALLEPASAVEANAPLIEAILRMHDLGVRQLVVVEACTRARAQTLDSARVVGVIAMSDLMRAQARACR